MNALFFAVLAVGVISTVICLGAGIRRLVPNDVTILSVAAVELALLVYMVVAIIGAITGAGPAGPSWEFWGYLFTVLVIPIGAVYWSLIERTLWSNYVLAIVGVTAVVMTARMNQIWHGSLTVALGG